MRRFLVATAALVALGIGGQAQATCVGTGLVVSPDHGAGTTCTITADAPSMIFVFDFKNAADTDVVAVGANMFNNQTSPVGSQFTLTGLTVGQTLNLVFTNATHGNSFTPGVAASDGFQHVAVRPTYADFQTDARTTVTQADLDASFGVMTGIAPISDWTFVGMEDLLASQGSDFDYNDLVLSYIGIGTDPPAVPEPTSVGLLGVGLIGLGLIRRRKAT